jgi:hypothetical protein
MPRVAPVTIAARPAKSLVFSLMASNGATPLSTGAQPGGAVHNLVASLPSSDRLGEAGSAGRRRELRTTDDDLDDSTTGAMQWTPT